MLDEHVRNGAEAEAAGVRDGLAAVFVALNVVGGCAAGIIVAGIAVAVGDLADRWTEGDPADGLGDGSTGTRVGQDYFSALQCDGEPCRVGFRSAIAGSEHGARDPLRVVLTLYRVKYSRRVGERVHQADGLSRVGDSRSR